MDYIPYVINTLEYFSNSLIIGYKFFVVNQYLCNYDNYIGIPPIPPMSGAPAAAATSP